MNFRQIRHFDMKGTGGKGGGVWNLASFTYANCGKIRYVSDPVHRYTNIGKTEIFHF